MTVVPEAGTSRQIFGVAEGLEAQVLVGLLRSRDAGLFVYVARGERQLASTLESLRLVGSGFGVHEFPAWDCPAFTKTSPSPQVTAGRIGLLAALASGSLETPAVILTTASALLQRLPPSDHFRNTLIRLEIGQSCEVGALPARLDAMGYVRSPRVMDHGEYAVRGSLIDVFPSGQRRPLRLDFFGDDLEGIRLFDVSSQLTASQTEAVDIPPMSEIVLDAESISRFRRRYRTHFDMGLGRDSLYTALTAGVRVPGIEHWLGFFYQRTCLLCDYLPDAVFVFEDGIKPQLESGWREFRNEYEERQSSPAAFDGGGSIWGCPPEFMQTDPESLEGSLAANPQIQLRIASAPPEQEANDVGGRPIVGFGHHRSANTGSLLQHLREYVAECRKEGNVVVACWSEGSRDRFRQLLRDEGVHGSVLVDDLNSLSAGSGMLGLSVWRLEHGFRFRSLTVLSEQDIFGARLARPPRRKRKLPRFLTEGGQLSQGDLVVHVEHGIGRFVGLKTIEVGVFRHECIALEYAGGDIMYIPVENSEVLSRLGPEKHALDRLGSVNWQRRKARLKKRLLALARELVETAAKRQLQQAPAMARDSKSWDLLLSSFQYLDTEDQQQAVADVVADLECGRPMDRLICGDVGFGKTEVAVRAAFISAMAGWQVAILAPTTLLVRQHYARFSERLEEFPLEVRHLSRMTGTREAAATKAGLANGKVDIVIGTHTLLGRRIKFDRLGLLIVDEEQSFGVVQKERLKQLKSDLHVLALTATPIPRTLQLATTGVRDMSIISTPPIDRLAIRTYVLEFDPVAIRQALLREHYRGGQSFVVVPRIRDIAGLAKFLQEQVPEVSFRSAHGRMHSEKLANCMNGFYEGKFGVLLSTTIIASGLDIEAANTIVVCNADRFGLAQLYQIRGRVGRSDVRAYAYVTYSPKRPLNEQARRRLKAFSGLECLGAGFSVASQDLDIRGAGNLLGDEQSGHIREVGLELYQSMLEEAIAKLRAESGSERQVAAESSWTPQLRLGVDAKIPEEYVPDPDVRLGLYRRLATLTTDDELTEMKEELADRFGPVPSSLHTFFELLQIKSRCKEAGIASLSCGPKGAVVTFHDSSSADVDRLARFARLQRGQVRVNRDRIFFKRTWPSPRHHLSGARKIVGDLMEFKRRHAAGQYAVSSSMEWR